MKHTRFQRRYGMLPSRTGRLSQTDLVAFLAILLFIGAVFHTLAPSVSQQDNTTPAIPSKNTEYATKPDCLQNHIPCLIHKYSHKYGVNTDTALRIAKAESNFKADAVNYNTNKTWDKGVYQINDIHNVPDECRLNAECNIEWAIKTMQKQGTQPWYSSKHRWYEK